MLRLLEAVSWMAVIGGIVAGALVVVSFVGDLVIEEADRRKRRQIRRATKMASTAATVKADRLAG